VRPPSLTLTSHSATVAATMTAATSATGNPATAAIAPEPTAAGAGATTMVDASAGVGATTVLADPEEPLMAVMAEPRTSTRPPESIQRRDYTQHRRVPTAQLKATQSRRCLFCLQVGIAVFLGGDTSAAVTAAVVLVLATWTLAAWNAFVMEATAIGWPLMSGAIV
jgi:hypothetical protein